MAKLKIQSPFEPQGDQPAAIEALVKGFDSGKSHQCLLGVTGSGKTFTMAHVIERLQTPTLVVSHRRAAMRRADKVVVMEHGKVAAVGTAEELQRNSEIFRAIWEGTTAAEA